MSDIGDDSAGQSDWIREESEGSDSEDEQCPNCKYWAAGTEVCKDGVCQEPPQWTGSKTLEKSESPIVCSMDVYHAGPEFQENSCSWMTGEGNEAGVEDVGAHSSSSEYDHNENHLIDVDYKAGEGFCDSDIISSDQSLSEYEHSENRWSSSGSSLREVFRSSKHSALKRPIQPLQSRSAETARAKMNQAQSAQRPDRLNARRAGIGRTNVPGDLSRGTIMGDKAKNAGHIRIKISKSCTKECEVLRPGYKYNYSLTDRNRYTSVYDEILRSNEFLYFTDDDDGDVVEDDSEFGYDDQVSEITVLDTTDSKLESSFNMISTSNDRMDSSGESLRDGAVPGGKENSALELELSPLQDDDPPSSHLHPAFVTITGALIVEGNDVTNEQSLDTSKTATEENFQQNDMAEENVKSTDGAQEEVSEPSWNMINPEQDVTIMTTLENTSSFNCLGNILESVYLQTVRQQESNVNSICPDAALPCFQTTSNKNAEGVSRAGKPELALLSKICEETGAKVADCCTYELNESTELKFNQKLTLEVELGLGELSKGVGIDLSDSVGEIVRTPRCDAPGALEPFLPLIDSNKIKELETAITSSECKTLNSDGDTTGSQSAVQYPIIPLPRQYYMPFFNVLRNKKLVNKKVRRPPQKFFKLFQSKADTACVVAAECLNVEEEGEPKSVNEKTVKLQPQNFPKGREVPPGWKPGQYTTDQTINAKITGSATNDQSPKRKVKKGQAAKAKAHIKGCNNNKRRIMSSEASFNEAESEDNQSKDDKSSLSSESIESSDSTHTVGYGERYNPNSDDNSELDPRQRKHTFGQEFESKRMYYEKLNKAKKRSTRSSEKKALTSQVKFLKTIDEFCSAEENDNYDYEAYEDTYNAEMEKCIDPIEYHISLAKYYSGRPINLQVMNGNPPSEPSASLSGIRIKRARNSVPSAIGLERLRSLNVEDSYEGVKGKVGMWSLNTLYAHKLGISEVPQEHNLEGSNLQGDGKDEPAVSSLLIKQNVHNKHGKKRQVDRDRDSRTSKAQSARNVGLEKIALFDTERKVTYLDLLEAGSNTRGSKSKEQSFSDPYRDKMEAPGAQKSKSCDSSDNKNIIPLLPKDTAPAIEPEILKRVQLVRFKDPIPLESDKPIEQPDRSEEDTWCYSVNAMLLRANQALQQKKVSDAECNHHFPRPDSAKVVAPVIKPTSASFLSELLEQDKEEQKLVRQSKMQLNDLSKPIQDNRVKTEETDDRISVGQQGFSRGLVLSANDVKPSNDSMNIFPSINMKNVDTLHSPKHSAGILKIKASAPNKKHREMQPWKDEKFFPLCKSRSAISSVTPPNQPCIPPKKLVPIRYSYPVDATSSRTPVRFLKEAVMKKSIGEKIPAEKKRFPQKSELVAPMRSDHRVSTIVQMFSDFNSNAIPNGEDGVDDEDDASETIDVMGMPQTLRAREGLKDSAQINMTAFSTGSKLEGQGINRQRQCDSSSLFCNFEADVHFDVSNDKRYSSSQNSTEQADSYKTIKWNIYYGNHDDPDILLLEKKNKNTFPRNYRSNRNLDEAIKCPKYIMDENINGFDRVSFLNAAINNNHKEPLKPCIHNSHDIIECYNSNKSFETSSENIKEENCLYSAYNQFWDSRYEKKLPMTNQSEDRNKPNELPKEIKFPGDDLKVGASHWKNKAASISEITNKHAKSSQHTTQNNNAKNPSYNRILSERVKVFKKGNSSKSSSSIEISKPSKRIRVLDYRRGKIHLTRQKQEMCDKEKEDRGSRDSIQIQEESKCAATSDVVDEYALSAECESEYFKSSKSDFNWGKVSIPPPYPESCFNHDSRRSSERGSVYSAEAMSKGSKENSELTPTANVCQDCYEANKLDTTRPEESNRRFDLESLIDTCEEKNADEPEVKDIIDLEPNDNKQGFECEVSPLYERVDRRHFIRATYREKHFISMHILNPTVINSSCVVLKREDQLQTMKNEVKMESWQPNRKYLKLLRGVDIIQIVAQNQDRLSRTLASLVRSVSFVPAFHIRSLHPPEMIPVVLSVNMCGAESTDDVPLKEGTQTFPVFFNYNNGKLLNRVFTVYHLRPGMYSLQITNVDKCGPNASDFESKKKVLAGRLSLFKPSVQIEMDTSRILYLIGAMVNTYDQALRNITDIYDQAKRERDVGVYYRMTCGWAPKYVEFNGISMEMLNSFCVNCILRRQAMKKVEASNCYHVLETLFTPDLRMHQNHCDICGGCDATLPSLRNGDCLSGNRRSWLINSQGMALPTYTMPYKPKNVHYSVMLPRLPAFREVRNSNSVISRTLEDRSLRFLSVQGDMAADDTISGPLLNSGATQSHSSLTVSTNGRTQPDDEVKSAHDKYNVRVHYSEARLPVHCETAQSKRMQRLQEIKLELRMQREGQAPAADVTAESDSLNTLKYQDNSSTLPLIKSKDIDLVDNNKQGFQIDNDTTKFCRNYWLKSTPLSQEYYEPSMSVKESGDNFTHYFKSLGSENKSNWVRNYVAPPVYQPTTTGGRAKRLSAPLKLPPVKPRVSNAAVINNLRPVSKMMLHPTRFVIKKNVKPKITVTRSASLSSTGSNVSEITSSTSTTPSSSDTESSSETDFFTKYKRMGGPTSIEDIFARTLPKLRKAQMRLRPSNPDKADEDWLEYQNLLLKMKEKELPVLLEEVSADIEAAADKQACCEASNTSLHSEFDMCTDADEMRNLWKRIFPEVNIWTRKRSKRSKRKPLSMQPQHISVFI